MTSLIPRKTRDSKGSAAAPAAPAASCAPTGEANPDLPADHRLEGGDYFVPEELRALYKIDPDAEMVAVRSSGRAVSMDGMGRELPGLYGGPLTMVRQRWVDQLYAQVMGDPERFHDLRPYFPAGPDATPAERWSAIRYVEGRTHDLDITWPDGYSARDEQLWTHLWRVMRAREQLDRATKAAADRARWAREHACVCCPTVAPEVEQRDVHGATIRCCRACAILLAAAAVQQLSTQRVGEKTRGEWVLDYVRRDQPGHQ